MPVKKEKTPKITDRTFETKTSKSTVKKSSAKAAKPEDKTKKLKMQKFVSRK
jgi:hypothetical protein